MVRAKLINFLGLVSVLDIMQNNAYIPDNDDAYLIKPKDNKTITMIGERQKDDRLLFADHIYYLRNTSGPSVTRIFDYRGPWDMGYITAVSVTDFNKDGAPGYFYVYSGALYEPNITLILKSLTNRGLDMLIEIYGHEPAPLDYFWEKTLEL